jgi:hypothetical protein
MIARALAVALSIGAMPTAFAATPADYAYLFPIETPASTSPGSSAWRIDLAPEVYAWVQDPALRDIEVFNAAGQPVPFARLAIEPGTTALERTAAVPVLALPASATQASSSDLRLVIDRDADGRLRRIDAGEETPAKTATRDWLLDASAFKHPIDRVVLDWTEPASGVVARFAIEAGDDLQSWRNVGTATVLALEQDGARLERHDMSLGGVPAKYLRLHRLDDGAELSGLTAQARATEYGRAAPARAWMAAKLKPRPSVADAARSDIVRFDYALQAPLPVDSARIELANDNALAPITLFALPPAAATDAWKPLASITAFRLRQGDETIRNGDIELRGTERLRDFRIESRTPMATPPQLTLSFRPDSFVFLAEGGGPYSLGVGSSRARRAEYPVDAALASLRATLGKDWQPPIAALGSARVSGGEAALLPAPPPTPWRRWLLWAVLIGGAVLIAGFALSLLRGSKPPA